MCVAFNGNILYKKRSLFLWFQIHHDLSLSSKVRNEMKKKERKIANATHQIGMDRKKINCISLTCNGEKQ